MEPEERHRNAGWATARGRRRFAFHALTLIGVVAVLAVAAVSAVLVGPVWTRLLIGITRASDLLGALLVVGMSTMWALPLGATIGLRGRLSRFWLWSGICLTALTASVLPVLAWRGLDKTQPGFEIFRDSLTFGASNLSILLAWLGVPAGLIAVALTRERRSKATEVKEAEVPERHRPATREIAVFFGLLGALVLFRVATGGSSIDQSITRARNAVVIALVGESLWRGVLVGIIVGSGLAVTILLFLTRNMLRLPLAVPCGLLIAVSFFGSYGPPGLGKGSQPDGWMEFRAPGFQGAAWWSSALTPLILLVIFTAVMWIRVLLRKE